MHWITTGIRVISSSAAADDAGTSCRHVSSAQCHATIAYCVIWLLPPADSIHIRYFRTIAVLFPRPPSNGRTAQLKLEQPQRPRSPIASVVFHDGPRCKEMCRYSQVIINFRRWPLARMPQTQCSSSNILEHHHPGGLSAEQVLISVDHAVPLNISSTCVLLVNACLRSRRGRDPDSLASWRHVHGRLKFTTFAVPLSPQ